MAVSVREKPVLGGGKMQKNHIVPQGDISETGKGRVVAAGQWAAQELQVAGIRNGLCPKA